MARRTPDIAEALAKFEWARHHVTELECDILAWADSPTAPPIVLERKFHRDKGYVAFWFGEVRPPRRSFSLIAGDALNCYRSALDYLAGELVACGRTPRPRSPTQVQFPIVTKDRATYLHECRTRRLPGVSQRIVAMLAPYQPYARSSNDLEYRPLGELAELVRVDKHRNLLVSLVALNKGTVIHPRGTKYRLELMTKTLGPVTAKAGTEVIRIWLTPWGKAAEPEVCVDFDPAEQILLEGRFLMDTLEEIDDTVAEILGRFV